MTIISKPSIVTKNEAAQFTLNKTELSNHPSVVVNSYFHETANWKEVIMKFTSTTGNQIEILVFDCSIALPVANFLVSEHARNGFEIQSITICDHDGGTLHIGQMDLNMPDFDVAVSEPVVVNPTPADFISRVFSEAAPAFFMTDLTTYPVTIIGGSLNLYAIDSNNRYSYRFALDSSSGLPSIGSSLYNMRLYFAPINDALGIAVNFSGGWIPQTTKTINATDILNGYIEFSSLALTINNIHSIFSNNGDRPIGETILMISKISINPI